MENFSRENLGYKLRLPKRGMKYYEENFPKRDDIF